MKPTTSAGAGVPFDAALMLDRIGGDEELLQELVELFEQEAPRMLAEIRSSIEREDARGLERAAHQLRGSVGSFAAATAADAALVLESLGRDTRLAGALVHYETLAQAVGDLDSALRRYLLGNAP